MSVVSRTEISMRGVEVEGVGVIFEEVEGYGVVRMILVVEDVVNISSRCQWHIMAVMLSTALIMLLSWYLWLET